MINKIIILTFSIIFIGCSDVVIESCCIETMIDSYIKSTSQEERDEFMAKLNEINATRAENGFSPLDLCTEKYYFDRGWALEDKGCRSRVEDFENGDVYAIGNRQIPDN